MSEENGTELWVKKELGHLDRRVEELRQTQEKDSDEIWSELKEMRHERTSVLEKVGDIRGRLIILIALVSAIVSGAVAMLVSKK